MAEMALVFALSVSVLDGLFYRHFSKVKARYAPDPARFDLESGRVDETAMAAFN